MRTPLLVLASTAALLSPGAVALGEGASASVRVNLVRSASVNLTTPLILPAVTTATTGLATGSRASGRLSAGRRGVAASAISASNATLTIRGQAGEAMSMAVPASFKVVRSGGAEALTVQTSTSATDGVLLGNGADGTVSINVGGSVDVPADGDAPPGPYEGLLVLVVQYN